MLLNIAFISAIIFSSFHALPIPTDNVQLPQSLIYMGDTVTFALPIINTVTTGSSTNQGGELVTSPIRSNNQNRSGNLGQSGGSKNQRKPNESGGSSTQGNHNSQSNLNNDGAQQISAPSTSEGQKKCKEYYTVKEGDYSWHIAEVNKLTLPDLEELNPGKDFINIKVDDKICIKSDQQSFKEKNYQIKKGDKVDDLLAQHKMTKKEFQDANPRITDLNTIKTGEWIHLTPITSN